MYKRHVFGLKATERPVLQQIFNRNDKIRQSVKSLGPQKNNEKCKILSKLKFKRSIERQSMLPEEEHSQSRSTLAPIKSKTTSFVNQRQSQSIRENNLQKNEPKSMSQKSKSTASFNRLMKNSPLELNSYQSEVNFNSKSVEKKKQQSKVNFAPKEVQPKFVNFDLEMPKYPSNVQSELVKHDFNLEMIQQQGQIENLKKELLNAFDSEKQKSYEIDYLSRKTIELATVLSLKEGEINSLKHQLALNLQQTEMAKNQVLKVNAEFLRNQKEQIDLKDENERLKLAIFKEQSERMEKEKILKENEAKINVKNIENMKLAKDNEILIELVENMRQELLQIRKSNDEALIFLDKQ